MSSDYERRLQRIETWQGDVIRRFTADETAIANLTSQLSQQRPGQIGGSTNQSIEYFAWIPTSSTLAAATGTAPLITPGSGSFEIYSSTNGALLVDSGSAQTVYNSAGAIVGPTLVQLDVNNFAVVVPC